MSTVLVTGGAGAIGARLVAALRNAGWRVRALVHRRDVPGADESLLGDVAGDVEPAVAGVDAVLHLAAVTHARDPRAYRVNVEGTTALVRAAERARVRRFVHVSTRAIDPRGGAYSASKAEAEDVVRASTLDWVVVRLPEVYGTGGAEGIEEVIAQARAGQTILLVGRGAQEICPVHVDDVVPALVAALTAPPRRTHTLAGERTTIRAFAESARAASGSASPIRSVPVPVVAVAARASRFLPLPLYPDQLSRLLAPKPTDASSARDDLGFAPRPLDLRA